MQKNAQPFGLNQQYGATNPFGRFDVDHVPSAVAALRRRYPEMSTWEDAIWLASADTTKWSLVAQPPFVRKTGHPPREFGFVVFLRETDGAIHFERLLPAFNAQTGQFDKIALPSSVANTGKFTKTGFKPVIIEHTHPFPYVFGESVRGGYIKGPSEKTSGC